MLETSRRLFVVVVLLVPFAAVAEQIAEYRVKAEFLERFTRFVDWPALEPGEDVFIIGVIGRDPFGPYLQEMARERRIKGRPVEIRNLRDSSGVDGCHLLFIASSARGQLREILARCASRPVLTVGDSAGFAESGVIVNLYGAGEQVRFEINEAAAERSGLRVSSKLLKLGRVVGGDGR